MGSAARSRPARYHRLAWDPCADPSKTERCGPDACRDRKQRACEVGSARTSADRPGSRSQSLAAVCTCCLHRHEAVHAPEQRGRAHGLSRLRPRCAGRAWMAWTCALQPASGPRCRTCAPRLWRTCAPGCCRPCPGRWGRHARFVEDAQAWPHLGLCRAGEKSRAGWLAPLPSGVSSFAPTAARRGRGRLREPG